MNEKSRLDWQYGHWLYKFNLYTCTSVKTTVPQITNPPKQEAAETENQHHNRNKTSRLLPTKSDSHTRKGRRKKPQTTTQGKQIVTHYSKFYYGRIENHHPMNKELE